jgi:enoyl-CoA hydratase/carnithine racemase
MTQEPVYVTIDGAIAQLILNRPDKRNALTRAMWAAIREHAAAVATNPEVKVLVLRGATPAAFAAGADIAEFEEVFASTATAHAYHCLIHAVYDALAELAVPTIAMVQGVCFGGGCALALCCDLRYAAPARPSAFRRPGSASPIRSPRPDVWSSWWGHRGPRRCSWARA